jgi:hypothetical protein
MKGDTEPPDSDLERGEFETLSVASDREFYFAVGSGLLTTGLSMALTAWLIAKDKGDPLAIAVLATINGAFVINLFMFVGQRKGQRAAVARSKAALKVMEKLPEKTVEKINGGLERAHKSKYEDVAKRTAKETVEAMRADGWTPPAKDNT